MTTIEEEKLRQQQAAQQQTVQQQPVQQTQAEAYTGNGAAALRQPQQVYNPSNDQAYVAAMNALKKAEANAPTYAGTYDAQIADAYEKIVGRGKFQYDPNGDALFQNYRNLYQDMGRQAMQDTMGQAAGLTGGYGSTYGQMAGQQAYDAYLRQINDKLPEFYGMAQDAYAQEGAQMAQQYAMLGDLRDAEYGRYQDDYSKWAADRAYAQSAADTAYNRGFQQWQTNYNAMQDSYDRLAALIGSYGYEATDDELESAGMSRAQATAIRNKWVQANTPRSSGGGKSSGTTGGYTPVTTEQSVLNLGYGPLSPEALADKVAAGEVVSYKIGDTLQFANTSKAQQKAPAAQTGAQVASGLNSALLEQIKNKKKK